MATNTMSPRLVSSVIARRRLAPNPRVRGGRVHGADSNKKQTPEYDDTVTKYQSFIRCRSGKARWTTGLLRAAKSVTRNDVFKLRRYRALIARRRHQSLEDEFLDAF